MPEIFPSKYILEDFENALPYFCAFLPNCIYTIEKLLAGLNVQLRIHSLVNVFVALPVFTRIAGTS